MLADITKLKSWRCLLRVCYVKVWEWRPVECARTHTHNKIRLLGARGRLLVLQDPREQKEENAGWRSVGRFWRPMRRQHTSSDIINVLRKCFPGLVLCETLVWETTQRAVLINKLQYFLYFAFLQFLITQDVWSPTVCITTNYFTIKVVWCK